MKIIKLLPRVNSANNQINFQLRKRTLPKVFQERLSKSKLKCIKVDLENFDWDDDS